MNILEELNAILSPILPVETGVFSGEPPDKYIVLTPMIDGTAVYGDNRPVIDVSEVRISVFIIGNYIDKVKEIRDALLAADFTITLRRFIEHENDTGHNHYNFDAEKSYLYN